MAGMAQRLGLLLPIFLTRLALPSTARRRPTGKQFTCQRFYVQNNYANYDFIIMIDALIRSLNAKSNNSADNIVDISPLISETTPVFPGDTGFKRDVLMDFSQGDHLALSSVTTTVHLGSHTDAPYHYHPQGRTIEKQDLTRYLGAAQVVDATHIRDGAITLEDLPGLEIQQEKVLFKTNSFPHEGPWQNEFASLSPTFIVWLSEQGVQTVGIDTPSVDPATSKDLLGHQAIYQCDMTILEGLDLRQAVCSQAYTLIALPLKIAGGDASPVRAVLLKDD